MLKFDQKGTWRPLLDHALKDQVSASAREKLAAASPMSLRNACNHLLSLTDRNAVVDAVFAFIRSRTVAGYHGSRLTNTEVESIGADGLTSLTSESRRRRLRRALSQHPQWYRKAEKLDEYMHAHGQGERSGRRLGQAHLTLSRQGLVEDFNCYLTHGSEFDQRVAFDLLGSEGVELLRMDGHARVIEFAVPGDCALKAANPYDRLDEIWRGAELPNLVSELLGAWAFGLADPELDCGSLCVDCGMIFFSGVPPTWFKNVETLSI